jgi:hypothetical protein
MKNSSLYIIAVCLAPVIREEHPLLSETDPVDSLYVIFEMHQVVEDQPLRLAHGVVTGKCLLRIDTFQVNAFDVIPHLRNAAKGTHPLFVALRFVANADGALGLGEDEREWLEIG